MDGTHLFKILPEVTDMPPAVAEPNDAQPHRPVRHGHVSPFLPVEKMPGAEERWRHMRTRYRFRAFLRADDSLLNAQ